jgi:hypothetical protein
MKGKLKSYSYHASHEDSFDGRRGTSHWMEDGAADR